MPKLITEIRPGDKVLCPSDNDPHGPAVWKEVLRTFKNKPAALLALMTDRGNVVYPTANHPIFIVERGWTPAGSLQPGDPLLSRDGRPARVASISETGLIEEVYNLQVADNRTYFVSDGEHDFSVLVHNESPGAQQSSRNWNPEGVQRILEGLDPDLAAWLGQQVFVLGPTMRGPSVGQIQSSGSGIGGWWATGVSVSDGNGKRVRTICLNNGASSVAASRDASCSLTIYLRRTTVTWFGRPRRCSSANGAGADAPARAKRRRR